MQTTNPHLSKRSFVSNFVHHTNQKIKKGFKSISFVQETNDQILDISTQTNFKSQTSIFRGPKPKPRVGIYRETCTQTSKTVIILDNDSPRHSISPDSLSPKSIREPTLIHKSGDINFNDSSGISVEDFLSERESTKKLLTGDALTKTFLAKLEKKPRDNLWLKSEHIQTSRLTSPKHKSKYTSKVNPGNINQHKVHSGKLQSFMSPTIASGIKDQRTVIRNISKLISPTRRGRSISPKSTNSRNVKGKKVPYIDKSDVTINKLPSHRSSPTILSLKNASDEVNCDMSIRLETCSSINSTECAFAQSLSKLKEDNWSTALVGLAEIVEICRVMDVESVFPQMTVVNQRLIELIKCPRSHVVRTACQAVGHLFEHVKDTRRPEFDELVDTLLCKTADSNKHIRHDANLSLDCMVTHIPTFHAVRALLSKGPQHKNSLVRTATARLLVCAIVITGPQNILNPHNNESTRRRIIVSMVRFLDDKCQEVRKYGERMYKLLCKDRIFELYLRKYLEPEIVSKMRQCILSNGQRL